MAGRDRVRLVSPPSPATHIDQLTPAKPRLRSSLQSSCRGPPPGSSGICPCPYCGWTQYRAKWQAVSCG